MKKLVKIIAAVMAVAICLASLSACGSTTEPEATESTKVLTFGTNPEFEPFEYVDSENGVIGDYNGIDMVIAKQLAEDNGMDVAVESIEFDSLIIALQNGQIDAAIAGMTITEDRKQSVDFTIPYYTATQVMITKEGSGITCAADMKDKTIAVVHGYTGATVVEDLGFKYTAFKKGTECILELVNGKADVVVLDSATAEKYVADQEGLIIVEDPDAFASEQYGIAVKKGNTELLDMLNASLEKMLAEGTIASIAVDFIDS